MPAIVAADVTYTEAGYPIRRLDGGGPPRYKNLVTLAFGAGASTTYPANGIPLTGTKLGMPSNVVEVIVVITNLNAQYWTYDRVNNTLRSIIYTSGVETATGATVNATSLVVEVTGY